MKSFIVMCLVVIAGLLASLIIFQQVLGATAGIPVTVPSAGGGGAVLVSTSSGAYIATTTSPFHVSSIFATSTATSTLPNVAGTGLSFAYLCLTGDVCHSTWPGGLSSYDAWTHPVAGQSATTSVVMTSGGLVVNAASSTFAGPANTSTTTVNSSFVFAPIGNCSTSESVGGCVRMNFSNSNGGLHLFTNNTSGAPLFDVDFTGATANTQPFRVESTASNQTTLDISGAPTGLGTLKIDAGSTGAVGSNSSAHISIDAFTGSYNGMALFMKCKGAGTSTPCFEAFDSSSNTLFKLDGQGNSTTTGIVEINGSGTSTVLQGGFSIKKTLDVQSTAATSTFANGVQFTGGTIQNTGWASAGTLCVKSISGVLTLAATDCGSSSGLTSYDAWTHPASGQSATTSTMIFTTGGLVINAASSTVQGNFNIIGNATTTNATTTTFSISNFLTIPNSTAAPTFATAGAFALETKTASSGIAYYDGTAIRTIYATQEHSATLASSTLTYIGAFGASGTTTLLFANYATPVTLLGIYCKTDIGTAWVGFGTGSATTSEAQCSKSGTFVPLSSSNTWTQRQNFFIEVGTSASSPNTISVTADVRPDSN